MEVWRYSRQMWTDYQVFLSTECSRSLNVASTQDERPAADMLRGGPNRAVSSQLRGRCGERTSTSPPSSMLWTSLQFPDYWCSIRKGVRGDSQTTQKCPGVAATSLNERFGNSQIVPRHIIWREGAGVEEGGREEGKQERGTKEERKGKEWNRKGIENWKW